MSWLRSRPKIKRGTRNTVATGIGASLTRPVSRGKSTRPKSWHDTLKKILTTLLLRRPIGASVSFQTIDYLDLLCFFFEESIPRRISSLIAAASDGIGLCVRRQSSMSWTSSKSSCIALRTTSCLVGIFTPRLHLWTCVYRHFGPPGRICAAESIYDPSMG